MTGSSCRPGPAPCERKFKRFKASLELLSCPHHIHFLIIDKEITWTQNKSWVDRGSRLY